MYINTLFLKTFKINRKLYYQSVAFIITFLYIAVNHGQRSVIASSKLIQEKEQRLPIDKEFHSKSDFYLMVGNNNIKINIKQSKYSLIIGMALGSYSLGKLSDQVNLRLMLCAYSVIAGGLFVALGFFMDEWFVQWINNEERFRVIMMMLMFLNGFVYSACYPACAGLVLTWIDEKNRGRLATIWAGSLNFGGVAFFQMSYFNTATLGLDWRINYYCTAVIFLMLGLLTYFVLEPYPEQLGIQIQQAENVIVGKTVSGRTEKDQLKQFFQIRYVQVILIIYTISITGGSVLDFWLYSYLQDQGLYVSAHKISQLYEFFSFIGGLVIGVLLDKKYKTYKVSVFCVLFLVTASCFLIIQYNYKKLVYFLVVSLIGLTMGANQNYLVSVTAKLLLDDPQVQATGLQISTLVGLIETFSSSFVMINFWIIPKHLDNLFFILGVECLVAAMVCIPQVRLEFKQNEKMKEKQKEKEKYQERKDSQEGDCLLQQ